jgi:hypothetical protein
MKKLILTLLSGMLPVILFAQNPKGSFSLTPMAGINVTGLSGATTDIYKYKVRLTAGVEAEYGVNDWLGLSLGAFYSQQGAKIDFSSFSVAPDENGIEYCYTKEKYGKLHCDYLNFPLLANIYFPKIRGLAFKIGMQMGVLVNDKLDVVRVRTASLDSTIGTDDGDTATVGEVGEIALATASRNDYEAEINKEDNEYRVSVLMQGLSVREQEIVSRKFGIGFDRAYELDEIATELGYTHERVRQLLAEALKKLKGRANMLKRFMAM